MIDLIKKLKTPTLLIDETKCRQNIEKMVNKFSALEIPIRPHFKTPQSAEICAWYKEYGINKATVSSVQMAKYFADAGWNDILIAFPVNLHELEEINELAGKITLHLVIVDAKTIPQLKNKVSNPISVWVKINTGTNRTGITFENMEDMENIFKEAEKLSIAIEGLLAHNGHTYHINDKNRITEIHETSIEHLSSIKSLFGRNLKISLGDTPACTLCENFDEVDEVRPGNFVFYDLVMSENKVCTENQVAVAMACPVVAKHSERNEIVIYGGAVHFSKDSMLIDGEQCFGKLAEWTETGWKQKRSAAKLVRLSQEHGIIKLNNEQFDEVNLGDFVLILPVHSCLTADNMPHYMSTSGEIISKFRFQGLLH